jgi:hypothetical protein
LTLAMRAAVEDKTRAETEKNDAIETSLSCAASARDDARAASNDDDAFFCVSDFVFFS